jgi:signal peptidase I
MARPRRPWLAALLSLLGSSGLGQLYNGTALKAAVFLLGLPPAAFLLLWLMTRLPVPPLNIVLPLLAVLGLQVWVCVDAARDARRLHDLPRPWYSRWFALVPVWALNAFVLAPAWTGFLFSSCIQAFKIPSGGMERTLLIGDHLLVDKAAYGVRLPFGSMILGRREPERGDLVVFLFPEDRERVFIKRLIGLPGETVEIRDKTVYVNGRPVAEPYAVFLDLPEDGPRMNWGPEQIPAGQLFVLGDNRDNSRDSRFWGFVPVGDVLGVAKVVYFSWDPRNSRVRWARIGQTLD